MNIQEFWGKWREKAKARREKADAVWRALLADIEADNERLIAEGEAAAAEMEKAMNELNNKPLTDPEGYTGEGYMSELTKAQEMRRDFRLAHKAGENKANLAAMALLLAEAEAAERASERDEKLAALCEKITTTGEPLSDMDCEMLKGYLDGGEKGFDRLLDFSQPPPARRWLFKDWLPAERVALLTGTGGFGKSTLALALALDVAVGDGTYQHPFGDFPQAATHGRVVFATYEDELDEFARRIQKACHTAGEQRNMKNIGVSPNFLHVLDLAPHGALWAPSLDGGQSVNSRAELTPTGQRLREYCERINALWLIVDPLAAAYLSDENNRGLVRAFMSDWDAWSKASKCAVLFIAHPPKSKTSGNTFSGSTDWHAAARAVLMLEYAEDKDDGEDDKKDEDKQVELRHIKASYAKRQEAVPLSWEDGTLTGDKSHDPNDV